MVHGKEKRDRYGVKGRFSGSFAGHGREEIVMERNELRLLLEQVAGGKMSIDAAMLRLKEAPFEGLGFAKLDHHRAVRQGIAEVIYGVGKTPEQIREIASAMYRHGQNTVLISAALMGVSVLFRSQLLSLLFGRVEPDVMEASLTYLVISALSFPALAVYYSAAALFRSMGKTKAIMNLSIAMNAINVIGNAIGIFALHAGVAGVAVPSLVSRTFAAVVMLVLCFQKKNTLYVELGKALTWNGKMLKRILNIAVPNGVENGLFQLSKVALSSIVALFGTVQIAANGVAQSFWSMASLFCIAFGYAFVTVIGQCMGAGDTEAADYYNKKLLRITYIGSAVWNLLIMILTPFVLMLYSLSEDTRNLVILLVIIHSVFNVALCPVAFSLSNGLRAAGDIKFTMYASIFATVVCRVIFTILLGVWMDLGVIGICLAMVGDWLVKAALILVRYRSHKWTKFQVID